MPSTPADNNPFRRPSLTRSGPPPSYISPSNNPFDPSATELQTMNIPGVGSAQSDLDSDHISLPTPAYTRKPSQSERRLIAPRRPNQLPVEASLVTNARETTNSIQQGGHEAPPPYELHSRTAKETSRAFADRIEPLRRPLEATPAAVLQGGQLFNNDGITGSGLFTGDRRLNEYREEAEAQRNDLERANQKRQQRKRRGGIWKCIVCCLPTRKKQAKMRSLKVPIFAGLGLLGVIITTVVVLLKVSKQGTDQTTKSAGRPSPVMLSLPGLPPIPTGLGIVQPASEPLKGTSCYMYPSLWSCDLAPLIPSFLFEIKHRKTDPFNHGPDSLWLPRPSMFPSLADLQTVGIRDKVVGKKEGEQTEFTISLVMSSDVRSISESNPQGFSIEVDTLKRSLEQDLIKRQETTIADPSTNPANLLPTVMRNQPVRIYDKGLNSEHYQTYIYFNKHIYLRSLNVSNPIPETNSTNLQGMKTTVEAPGSQADVACALRFTTFKVQIWTKKSGEYVVVDQEQNRMGIDPEFGRLIRNDTAILPYPVTVSEDRSGGPDADAGRTTRCWRIVDDEANPGKKRLQMGDGFGMYEKSFMKLEKLDRGCFCEWRNWREMGRLDVGNAS